MESRMKKAMKIRGMKYLSVFLVLLLMITATEPIWAGAFSSEKPYEIIIESLTRGRAMPDLDKVEAAINEITVPAINCTVKIENVSIADHARVMDLTVAQNKRIDIVNTGRTTPLTEMVDHNLLIPLDDLVKKYAPDLIKKEADLLKGSMLNGNLYALPADLYSGMRSGFLYNADMAKEYGIKIADIMTLEQIEDAAKILLSHDKYLLSQGGGNEDPVLLGILFPDIKPLDHSIFANGVLIRGNDKKLQNAFETQEFLQYCQMIRRWKENGWIPSDSLVSGRLANDLFQNQETFMTWLSITPTELALQQKNYSFNIGAFATTEKAILTTNQVQSNGWGISSTSLRPEKAMEFLNLLYTDENLANLMMNGIEGIHYEKVSEHIIRYPEGITAETVGYYRRLSYFGDTMQVFQWEPTTEDFYDELREFKANLQTGPFWGYSFDITPVSEEYRAVTNVLSIYLPPLECGMVANVEAAVNKLNTELRNAGIEHILAENQRQLNLWQQANSLG